MFIYDNNVFALLSRESNNEPENNDFNSRRTKLGYEVRKRVEEFLAQYVLFYKFPSTTTSLTLNGVTFI